jgi:hypothetical protein
MQTLMGYLNHAGMFAVERRNALLSGLTMNEAVIMNIQEKEMLMLYICKR